MTAYELVGCPGHLNIAAGDPDAARIGLGALALRMAGLGLAVFPLTPGTNRPLPRSRSFMDASRDPRQIDAWWREERARNIGLATGQVSGLIAIDLDRKRGVDGPGNWLSWLAEHRLTVPDGPWVKTPNNGVHVLLRVPAGRVVPSRNGVLPGADIKADGGYIAAHRSGIRFAPAERPGEPKPGAGDHYFVPYRMTGCFCEVPDAPPELLDALDQLHGSGGGGDTGHGGTGGGGHDWEVARSVMSDVLRGLDQEACYANWLETAQPANPAWPFTRRDFERHYRGAVRKAAKVRADEERWMGEAARWAAGTVSEPGTDQLVAQWQARRDAGWPL